MAQTQAFGMTMAKHHYMRPHDRESSNWLGGFWSSVSMSIHVTIKAGHHSMQYHSGTRMSLYYCWSMVQTQAFGTTMAKHHYMRPHNRETSSWLGGFWSSVSMSTRVTIKAGHRSMQCHSATRMSVYYCWSMVQTQAFGTTMARLHYTWPHARET